MVTGITTFAILISVDLARYEIFCVKSLQFLTREVCEVYFGHILEELTTRPHLSQGQDRSPDSALPIT